MFIVQVTDSTFSVNSDPLPVMVAMKVAQTWIERGDKVICIRSADGAQSWSLKDFVTDAFGPAD